MTVYQFNGLTLQILTSRMGFASFSEAGVIGLNAEYFVNVEARVSTSMT